MYATRLRVHRRFVVSRISASFVVYLDRAEENMIAQLMTEKEKAAITVKACTLHDTGNEDEAMALFKTLPMPPFLAKVMKEKIGPEYLITSGWNLSEAEAAFGQGWLAR
jgi:hypothetical protein